MEHPTAECGTATGGSQPTAADGKFPRRSEDKKLPPFMVEVVHEIAGRVERLGASLNKGDAFIKQVGEEQYGLLCEQFNSMRDYRDTLAVRLSLLRRANA